MKYIRTSWSHESMFHQVDADDVITDFVTHARGTLPMPGIEERVARLQDLVGRIADHLNIDVTQLLNVHETKYQYEPKPSGTDSD